MKFSVTYLQIRFKNTSKRLPTMIKLASPNDQVGFISEVHGWFTTHKSINVINHHIYDLKDRIHTVITIDLNGQNPLSLHD